MGKWSDDSERYPVLTGGVFYKSPRPDMPDEVHVDMAAFKRASEAARHRYEATLPKCVTTFYLAPVEHNRETKPLEPGSLEAEAAMSALRNIPFPYLRISQRVTVEDGEAMDTEVICFGDGKLFGWMARDRSIKTGKTSYTPTGITPAIDESLPLSYLHLMRALSNNSARYIEAPISRQVRRREGFAEGYREYIVLARPTTEERTSALRLSVIMRRHPRLHAVRGHLVHYRSERYKFMRNKVGYRPPHARGGDPNKFEILQVKDYVDQQVFVVGEDAE